MTHGFFEFMKIIELAMVHVMDSFEDKCMFSSVGFLYSS
jgi:hypothetical protein